MFNNEWLKRIKRDTNLFHNKQLFGSQLFHPTKLNCHARREYISIVQGSGFEPTSTRSQAAAAQWL